MPPHYLRLRWLCGRLTQMIMRKKIEKLRNELRKEVDRLKLLKTTEESISLRHQYNEKISQLLIRINDLNDILWE